MAVESPPWALQAGSYPAEQTRRAVFAWAARTAANSPGIISGGLLSAADLQMTAPVSGLTVNLGPGECLIPGNEGGAQGGVYARATSTTSLSIAAASVSNPRIDLICATVNDAGYTPPAGSVGSGTWAPQVITGTPTAGATLANLNGVGTLPLSSLLLGYVLVPTSATNIITADIANVATPIAGGLSANPNSAKRQLLLQATGLVPSGTTAGTYLLNSYGAISGSGLAEAGTPAWMVPVWMDDGGWASQPQDFQVSGKSAFGRVRGSALTNGTASSVSVTLGIHQVTAVGGTSGVMAYTFGSALSATNTVAVGTNGGYGFESVAFALPASGSTYALGVNLSGTTAAGSVIAITAQLYCYNA